MFSISVWLFAEYITDDKPSSQSAPPSSLP
jgi:hypothetical protein